MRQNPDPVCFAAVTASLAGGIFLLTGGNYLDRIFRAGWFFTPFGYTILKVYLCQSDAVQVAKWGNSLAVRLPSSLVEALKLCEGDDIEIVIDAPRTFAVRKKLDTDALLERLRQFRGRLPADFKFDRDEANERF